MKKKKVRTNKDIEREIEVLSHLQEEYKFNYQVNINSIFNITLLSASFFILILSLSINLIINREYISGTILVIFTAIVFPIFVKIVTRTNRVEAEKIKVNYRSNVEKMKERYEILGVNIKQFYKK